MILNHICFSNVTGSKSTSGDGGEVEDNGDHHDDDLVKIDNNNHHESVTSECSDESMVNEDESIPIDGTIGENGDRKPELNSIKMFVGQIPRDWTEYECRELLSEFGEIYSLHVLRDKKTSISRGCCFITYYSRKSALEAQNALHNIRTLPGVSR